MPPDPGGPCRCRSSRYGSTRRRRHVRPTTRSEAPPGLAAATSCLRGTGPVDARTTRRVARTRAGRVRSLPSRIASSSSTACSPLRRDRLVDRGEGWVGRSARARRRRSPTTLRSAGHGQAPLAGRPHRADRRWRRSWPGRRSDAGRRPRSRRTTRRRRRSWPGRRDDRPARAGRCPRRRAPPDSRAGGGPRRRPASSGVGAVRRLDRRARRTSRWPRPIRWSAASRAPPSSSTSIAALAGQGRRVDEDHRQAGPPDLLDLRVVRRQTDRRRPRRPSPG